MFAWCSRQSHDTWWTVVWRSLGGQPMIMNLLTSQLTWNNFNAFAPRFLLPPEIREIRDLYTKCLARWDDFHPVQQEEIIRLFSSSFQGNNNGFSFQGGMMIQNALPASATLRFFSLMPLTCRPVTLSDPAEFEKLIDPFSSSTQNALRELVNYLHAISRLPEKVKLSFKRALYLHGAPGTGKTFSLQRLASLLSMELVIFKSNSRLEEIDTPSSNTSRLYSPTPWNLMIKSSSSGTPVADAILKNRAAPFPRNFIFFIDDFDKFSPIEANLKELLQNLDNDEMYNFRPIDWRSDRVLLVLAGNLSLDDLCAKFDSSDSLKSRISNGEILFPDLNLESKRKIVKQKVENFCLDLEYQVSSDDLEQIDRMCREDPHPGVRQLIHQVQSYLCERKVRSEMK